MTTTTATQAATETTTRPADDLTTEKRPTTAPEADKPAERHTEPTEDNTEATPDNTEDRKPATKEQRYRLALREAEAQRDELAQHVEALQRRAAEDAARAILASPADLFEIHGATLADLTDENGFVDAERVAEIAREAIATRPGLARFPQARRADPHQGRREFAGTDRNAMADAFAPRR